MSSEANRFGAMLTSFKRIPRMGEYFDKPFPLSWPKATENKRGSIPGSTAAGGLAHGLCRIKPIMDSEWNLPFTQRTLEPLVIRR